MEKRIILAFILSFAVLYVFGRLFSPPPTANRAPETAQAPLSSNPNPPDEVVDRTSRPAPAQDIQADQSEDLVVDTPLYAATVSNVGGVLKSYKLKAYSDSEGRPIELIDEKSAAKLGWPLAVVTGDPGLDEALAKAHFVARREGNRVSLEFASSGIEARKILEFDPGNFEFSLAVELAKDGNKLQPAVVWQGGFGDPVADATKRNAVYELDGAFNRLAAGSIKEQQ